MKATHLLGLALAERLRHYRDAGDPVLDRFARLQEQVLHVESLREAIDIHGSRWDKLPERQRPHYTPEARFRILRLRNLLAFSAQDTAQLFRVSPNTVLRWDEEARGAGERRTVGSLLKPVPPIRRYADLVRHLVQTMILAGFPGDRSVALHLSRAGWKLSRRTVQRMRHEQPVAPVPPATGKHQRAVRAKYPNHVWMLDLTEIPGLLRLFSFKLAVILDVFSRAPLAARVFYQEPTGRDIAKLLTRTARRFGPPRHSVSDQGAQFKSGPFRKALARHGIKHRYGAIGKTGSIAIIERFFRTLKAIAGVRLRPPLLRRDLESRLAPASSTTSGSVPIRGSAARRRPKDASPPGATDLRCHRHAGRPAKPSTWPSTSRSVTSIPSSASPTSSAKPRS
jgi:transposase InsO family protein